MKYVKMDKMTAESMLSFKESKQEGDDYDGEPVEYKSIKFKFNF